MMADERHHYHEGRIHTAGELHGLPVKAVPPLECPWQNCASVNDDREIEGHNRSREMERRLCVIVKARVTRSERRRKTRREWGRILETVEGVGWSIMFAVVNGEIEGDERRES